MAKIFFVICPQCKKKFPCLYEDLRHKDIKLICPFCALSFHQEESPSIEE